MKNLKDILFEDFFKNVGSTPEDNKKRKIEAWLKEYNIKNYTINKDFTIDTDKSLIILNYNEKNFPDYIQFGTVRSDFILSHTSLTSLRGCPNRVIGSFKCLYNDKLKNMEYCPQVGKDFSISNNKNLKTLAGIQSHIYGYFWCKDNPKLEDFGNIKSIYFNLYVTRCYKLHPINGRWDKIKNLSRVGADYE